MTARVSPVGGQGAGSSQSNNSRFTIRPPTTGGDDGRPSGSLLKDVHRMFALIEDERHLCAFELYKSIQERLQEWDSQNKHSPSANARNVNSHRKPGVSLRRNNKGATEARQALATANHEAEAAKDLLQSKAGVINKLVNRSRLFLEAKRNLEVDDDWILSQTLFGVTTYYRREPDNSLSIKLEGELKNVPVFEQICVLKEVDLHCQWAPFCTSSMVIDELDKLDMVGWFVLGLPHLGMARDGCFRAIGCDAMAEDGSFLLVGQGVHDRKPGDPPPDDTYLCDDPVLEEIGIPNPPTSIGSGRMTIRKFEAIVHILSPTNVRTRLIANVNPNLKFIPQSLLDFLMKKLCGVMLLKLQGAAKKILKNPVRNPHARRMRENPEFYKNWLQTKIELYCQEKGWEMPKVSAFEIMEPDVLANGTLSPTLLQLHSTSELDDELQRTPSGRHYVRTHSAPVMDFSATRDESDAMSGISTTFSSDSVKSNNPIVAYLREAEEKARRKKDEKVAESRRRTAERLKPKEFSVHQSARLAELKQAKARSIGDVDGRVVDGSFSSVGSVARSVNSKHSMSSKTTTTSTESPRSHSQVQRLFAILTLVTALFATLYSHSLIDFSNFFPSDGRWVYLGQSLVTITYVTIAAFLHFYLSEVVLEYAFDSLELGKKSGKEARRYYSDNIRVGIAAVSVGIVLLSVTRAWLAVGFRGSVWTIIQISRWVQPQLQYVVIDFAGRISGIVPAIVRSWGTTVVASVEDVFGPVVGSVQYLLAMVLRGLYEILIASNSVGRTFEFVVMGSITTCVELVETLIGIIVRGPDGDAELPSWMGITVETSRVLFSYTSVFLLATVTIFKFVVGSRKSVAKSVAAVPNTTVGAPHTSSVNGETPRKLKVIPRRYSTIQEEAEEERDGLVMNQSGRMYSREEVSSVSAIQESNTQVSPINERTVSTEPTMRRRLFPRWRRKNRSTHDAETSPISSDSRSGERRRFRK